MRIGCGIDPSRDELTSEPRSVAATIDEIVDESVLIERAGFHSVRVPDRHDREECYFPGALPLLTLIARETHRVALGAFALVNPRYHPMLLAEQCAVIDTLSALGRLFMTWARGIDGFGFFGVPIDRLLGRFLENVTVIEQALRGERFGFHGEFYDVDDGLLTPRSYQRPRFPFWGGGKSATAIERSADYAEAWACDDIPFQDARWQGEAGAYREAARRRSKEPFIVLSRCAWVADTEKDAHAEFGLAYCDHLRRLSERGRLAHVPELADPARITSSDPRGCALVGSRIRTEREEQGG